MGKMTFAECMECLEKPSIVVLPLAIAAGILSYTYLPGTILWIIFLTVAIALLLLWSVVIAVSLIAVIRTCRKIGGDSISRTEKLFRSLRYLLSCALAVAILWVLSLWETTLLFKALAFGAVLLSIAAANIAYERTRRRLRHRFEQMES